MASLDQATVRRSIYNFWIGLPGRARPTALDGSDVARTTSSDFGLSTIFKRPVQPSSSVEDAAASNAERQSEAEIPPTFCNWIDLPSRIKWEIGSSSYKWLSSAIDTGDDFAKKGLQIASNLFPEGCFSSKSGPFRETIIKFHGFSIRVAGSFLFLDSLEICPQNGSLFRLYLKLKMPLAILRLTHTHTTSTEGVWMMTLNFGFEKPAMVAILAPCEYYDVKACAITCTRQSHDCFVIEYP